MGKRSSGREPAGLAVAARPGITWTGRRRGDYAGMVRRLSGCDGKTRRLTPAALWAIWRYNARMRHWLLTWTTYGTWLPGDARGFVSQHRVRDEQVIYNLPETPYDHHLSLLNRYAALQLKGSPVRLSREHALAVRDQLLETSAVRGWQICAGAIMATHIHLIVEAPTDCSADILLRDYKAYASRALNARWERPASGTWWTTSGSRRHILGEESLCRALEYVRAQEYPLVVWPE